MAFLRGQKELNKNLIHERIKGYAYLVVNGDVKIYFGEDAKKIKSNQTKEIVKPKNVVKGMSANPGKVIGIAKIVLSVEDIHKVEQGNILIATMTLPQFVPAMEKAIAFVTDEGGMTCHVAIIARELGVPCIVGTKEATKIFKDGDKIEVDANRGIVKKIFE